MRIFLALIAMLIAAAVATVVAGASSWHRATEAAVANSTLRDDANTGPLVFEFDAEGFVTSIQGDRFKENGGDGSPAAAPNPTGAAASTSITYRYNRLE